MDVPQKPLDGGFYQARKTSAAEWGEPRIVCPNCKQQFISFVGVFLLCKHDLKPSDWYMFYKLEI